MDTIGKLLLDDETGRVLRADDTLVVSQRYLDTHPYVASSRGSASYFIGPDAPAEVRGVSNRGDFLVFEPTQVVDGQVTLQKVEAS